MNDLYHFGIKGMHWGVRRSEDELARYRAKNMSNEELKNDNARVALERSYIKNHTSDVDSNKIKGSVETAASSSSNALSKVGKLFKDKPSGEDLSKLSNKDLQDRINRINLETTYSRLTSKPSRMRRGLEATGTVIEAVGGVAAAGLAVGGLYKLLTNK